VRLLKPLPICLFCLIAFLGVSAFTSAVPRVQSQKTILYVKPGANGNCGSWVDACELQIALGKATAGDQIWVATGTYKPTAIVDLDRTTTFQLISGVAIYGGFPASGGTWQDRDWGANITTLSGDIGIPNEKTDNCYHVVTGSGVKSSAILDGFTITAGNASGSSTSPYYSGGGMYNSAGSPTLTNVIFSGNSASGSGGGMYNSAGSPTIKNVTFSGNSARYGGGMTNGQSNCTLDNVNFYENSVTYAGGGMYNNNSSPTLTNVIFSGNSASGSGGGMYTTGNSNPTLTNVTFNDNTTVYYGGGMDNYASGHSTLINVTFSGNSAGVGGGGMHNYSCHLTLTNITFSDNYASENGGGILNIDSSITLTNITFSGNLATLKGGGMYHFASYGSNPTLTNVTLSGNSASTGAGIYNDGSRNPIITNAIIWGNIPDQIMDNSLTTIINNSVIQGGYPGTGNIAEDPLLGPLADNGGFTQTRAIGAGSPAIDTGSPTVCPVVDQRGYIRPVDGDGDVTAICDMGAYEFASSLATFSLSVDKQGGGLVAKYPDKPSYQFGEVVTLIATPDPTWNFSYWGGDIFKLENPLTVVVTRNMSATAIFYQLETFLPLISR